MSNVSQLATPYFRSVTAALPPSPVRSVPLMSSLSQPLPALPSAPSVAEGVLRLPEGAVVAPWPQAGLPAELLGGLNSLVGDVPMVGYLVLVPAGTAPAVPTEAAQPAGPVTGVAPLRSVGASRGSSAAAGSGTSGASASSGGIQLDLDRRTARVDGELLELTYLEFELLAHLTANPHRVHTRDHLVTAVWGYGHIGDGRTVDVHVARLRRKLGARYRAGIVTVRRVGYKYVPPKQA
jgi:hypothetical protein